MPYLVFADHAQEFERLELYTNSRGIVVGRASDCGVPVRDTLLSRHHCRFDPLGDRWIVSDLSSKNGTRVDGRPIERHVLRDGEVVRAGRTRICYRAGAFEPAPPGTQRSRDARPINPIDALDATVAGFHLGDMEEDSKSSGFPIPRPKPPEPHAFGRENVHAMVAELSSSAWDMSMTRQATALRRRPRNENVIDRDQSAILLVRPLAPCSTRTKLLPPAQVQPVAVISRWRLVVSVGLAVGVFAASMTVIALAWLNRVPVR